jgi:hypothetical protein
LIFALEAAMFEKTRRVSSSLSSACALLSFGDEHLMWLGNVVLSSEVSELN